MATPTRPSKDPGLYELYKSTVVSVLEARLGDEAGPLVDAVMEGIAPLLANDWEIVMGVIEKNKTLNRLLDAAREDERAYRKFENDAFEVCIGMRDGHLGSLDTLNKFFIKHQSAVRPLRYT